MASQSGTNYWFVLPHANSTCPQLGVLVTGYQVLPKLGVDVPPTVNHMIASIVPAMVLFLGGPQLL